jgi:hypothetical protein
MRFALQREADALDAGGHESNDDSDLEGTLYQHSSSLILDVFLPPGCLPQRSRPAIAPPCCTCLVLLRTRYVVTAVADACCEKYE